MPLERVIIKYNILAEQESPLTGKIRPQISNLWDIKDSISINII